MRDIVYAQSVSLYLTREIVYIYRDFAYVARDRVTKRHMCHVFRCDTPARQIANTLRDICEYPWQPRRAIIYFYYLCQKKIPQLGENQARG